MNIGYVFFIIIIGYIIFGDEACAYVSDPSEDDDWIASPMNKEGMNYQGKN